MTTPAKQLSSIANQEAPAAAHASLSDLTVEQLGQMFHGLDQTREKCESMSGVCATLAGLVLTEIKGRLKHGEWKPWLKEHFPKSAETARQYMRLSDEFRKKQPRLAFAQMTLALMDGAQDLEGQSLDMTHPVVSQVSKWTKGRSFYQLREDEVRNGGNNHPKCPHCEGDLKSKDQELCPHCGEQTGEKPPSEDEIRARYVEAVREWAADHLTDDRAERKMYRLLPDHEAEALAAHFLRIGREIQEWLKTPARRREEMAIEEVLS